VLRCITVTYTSILSIHFSLIIPLFFRYLLHHVFTSISSFLCPRLTPARLSTFLFVFMFIYIPLLSKNKVREWRTQLVFVTKTNPNTLLLSPWLKHELEQSSSQEKSKDFDWWPKFSLESGNTRKHLITGILCIISTFDLFFNRYLP